METITKRNETDILGTCAHEWAIFSLGGHEFYGFDFSDKAVILVNYDGKFIIGKKYKNCISIGSSVVREFDTFREAKDSIEPVCAHI